MGRELVKKLLGVGGGAGLGAACKQTQFMYCGEEAAQDMDNGRHLADLDQEVVRHPKAGRRIK